MSSLHLVAPGIKEVANVCNLSLMKLVTPEDDESDDTSQLPSQEEPPSYQEATDHGETMLYRCKG